MRWIKLGQIFDTRSVALPEGCTEFAQSPQVLAFPDVLRVYFSTRSRDASGAKFRSHVARVDMDTSLTATLGVGTHPVIEPGGLGCFDEHGIFPMSPVRVGEDVYGYTTGWSRRVSVSVETAIGLAVSRDNGKTFIRRGPGPVLAASPRQPFLVGDAFVRVFDGVFHMWYIFGTGWRRAAPGTEPERTYKIGHAVSDDGVAWVRDEGRRVVADHLGPDESQALPSVIQIGDRFHMYFCYRETFAFRDDPARGYRIGHAVSRDLREWVRGEDPIAPGHPGEWDSDMQCYPHVFESAGSVFLLYNGNAFGRFGFGAARLEP